MKFLNDLVCEGWQRSSHPITGDHFTDVNRTYLLDVPGGLHVLNVLYDPEGTDNTQVQTCKLNSKGDDNYSLDYVHQKIVRSQVDYKIEHEVRKQLALLDVEEKL